MSIFKSHQLFNALTLAYFNSYIPILLFFSVEDVTKTFLELLEKDNCNGDVVTVDKLRGTLYHYKKHKNRL